MATTSSGTQEDLWDSKTNVEDYEHVSSLLSASSSNQKRVKDSVPKGNSFVGLTKNLETTISSIESIPATYKRTRTNTTAFKGYHFL